MKNSPETIVVKTVNWRYRITGSVVSNVAEIPTSSSSPVMNWRYRVPNLNYEVLTTVKSTSEVNWRYRIPEVSSYDLN
jgi:hypothetical protein